MLDERGYIHIVGRDKRLGDFSGFNVYPKEVEQVIDEMVGVVGVGGESVCHTPIFGEV